MTEHPEVITVAEQAQAAGRVPALGMDELETLRLYCLTIIDRMPGNPHDHHLEMARYNLSGMISELRAFLNRR